MCQCIHQVSNTRTEHLLTGENTNFNNLFLDAYNVILIIAEEGGSNPKCTLKNKKIIISTRFLYEASTINYNFAT